MTDVNVYHLRENNADIIVPNLWLGNLESANDPTFIKSANIRYIINVSKHEICKFPSVKYCNIPISDKNLCEIGAKEMMFKYIDTSLKLINKGLRENVGVLVHCRKGHHRSANIILIFMMKCLKVGYIPSMTYINNIRPYALRRNTCIGSIILDYCKEIDT
jgi:hypothetical protein